MKPRSSVVTLGVDDIERSVTFYRDGLGLPTEGIVGRDSEIGGIAFFELRGGLKLAIMSRAGLAWETGTPQAPPSQAGFTLAHNVSTREEVDLVLEQALRAGAALVKPAQDVFWGGYSGYFQDPDGYLWEVAWNPFWPLDE